MDILMRIDIKISYYAANFLINSKCLSRGDLPFSEV